MPKCGVGAKLNVSDNSMNFSNDDENKMTKGIKNKFIDHIDKIVKKFIGYEECIKIFITELYSDNYLLDHQLIQVIVNEVPIPKSIDQIWVGHPVWISENEYTTEYKKIEY